MADLQLLIIVAIVVIIIATIAVIGGRRGSARRTNMMRAGEAARRRPCPGCGEAVMRQASICPHCHSELQPLRPATASEVAVAEQWSVWRPRVAMAATILIFYVAYLLIEAARRS